MCEKTEDGRCAARYMRVCMCTETIPIRSYEEMQRHDPIDRWRQTARRRGLMIRIPEVRKIASGIDKVCSPDVMKVTSGIDKVCNPDVRKIASRISKYHSLRITKEYLHDHHRCDVTETVNVGMKEGAA
ncbi:MAG: hypothetical protein FWD92_03055 [Methanomassiliicoccaceae archaeon]|nr:hypothetical protein [Methanomassiliicoccaceae archaeon]